MTNKLAQAFEKASQLPEAMQNAMADEMFAEMEGEYLFDAALENSQDMLGCMVREAQREANN